MTRPASPTALALSESHEAPAADPMSEPLSPSVLYRRFKPLFRPRPTVYWVDMIAAALLGWAGVATFLATPGMSILGLLGLFTGILALYRAVLFIHELSHLKHGAILGFETAWNLLVGIPLLVPSLMYVGTHADHHRRAQFATEEDPEYDPIAYWDPLRIYLSFVTMLFVPFLLVLRWGIAGPLSYLVPSLRRRVIERASSLVINPSYRRKRLRPGEVMDWAWQEGLSALWVWSLAAATAAGYLPGACLWKFYLIPAGILFVNHARTLAAHHYVNDDGLPTDRVGQLRDSINLTGSSPLTVLAAPVGLRFHALHHLLPALPYHSLGAVHRTLAHELPASSPYHETARRSITEGLVELLAQARRNAGRVERRSAAPYYPSRSR